MDKGRIYVYTGNGKGKTTAALGLAVRAKSRDLKVLFAQFMKDIEGGETTVLHALSIDTLVFRDVRAPLFHPGLDMQANRQAALAALSTLTGALQGYDLVVLDEFNILFRYNLITKEEAEAFLAQKPEHVELVLTGRNAPEWLISTADLVSEINNIKHPAENNHPARPGIDY